MKLYDILVVVRCPDQQRLGASAHGANKERRRDWLSRDFGRGGVHYRQFLRPVGPRRAGHTVAGEIIISLEFQP
ncbi:MAG TPA: hypothetical protein VM120_16985 [Bryobacteraceae bacterium]|nr:hypothetical protein [Bryobacteraceae bacterium]